MATPPLVPTRSRTARVCSAPWSNTTPSVATIAYRLRVSTSTVPVVVTPGSDRNTVVQQYRRFATSRTLHRSTTTNMNPTKKRQVRQQVPPLHTQMSPVLHRHRRPGRCLNVAPLQHLVGITMHRPLPRRPSRAWPPRGISVTDGVRARCRRQWRAVARKSRPCQSRRRRRRRVLVVVAQQHIVSQEVP